MRILFSQRFPPEARALVEGLTHKMAAWHGFENYEISFSLRAPREAVADISVVAESHRAEVRLHRNRLRPELLCPDLVHELLHIPKWRTYEALDLAFDSIAKSKRNPVKRVLLAEYEREHNEQAQVWLKVLPFLPSAPSALPPYASTITVPQTYSLPNVSVPSSSAQIALPQLQTLSAPAWTAPFSALPEQTQL